MKMSVLYFSKTGNTKDAEAIAKGMESVGSESAKAMSVKDLGVFVRKAPGGRRNADVLQYVRGRVKELADADAPYALPATGRRSRPAPTSMAAARSPFKTSFHCSFSMHLFRRRRCRCPAHPPGAGGHRQRPRFLCAFVRDLRAAHGDEGERTVLIGFRDK